MQSRDREVLHQGKKPKVCERKKKKVSLPTYETISFIRQKIH